MALRRTPSWRARAALIIWGLFSHILLEPSMSVNRSVTVPLGSATISYYASSFSTNGHYCIGTALAETEGVEDAQ